MLTLNNIAHTLRGIGRLLYPHVCPICGGRIEGDRQVFCTSCLVDAPVTEFEQLADNPVARRIWNFIPIQRASSLLYFVGDGDWRRLVYRFKFAGGWRYALIAGRMLGEAIGCSPIWSGVDCVAAVPLHRRRLLGRGYNQSEYIAQGVAEVLGVPLLRGALARQGHNPPQAQTDKELRWENVEGIFEVTRPELLENRHLLLIDDVFTTGATLISCGEAILRAVPSCRLSIATLYVSKQELGIKD